MASGRLGSAGSDIELAVDERGSAGDDAGLGADKAAAYHALPPTGRGRGVLVVDETGALTDFARDACDRLARAGFAALAPDLADAANAGPLLAAGVQYLLDDAATDGSGVGAVGFGLGGAMALAAGARNRRIRCVVDFYGVPDAEPPQDAPPLEVPTLLIFGEEDAQVLDGAARNLEARLTTARLKVEPGAGFGFMNEARADLHAATAAAAGWEATIAFLGASL
jgi:carboxymethylenebutenolidase